MLIHIIIVVIVAARHVVVDAVSHVVLVILEAQQVLGEGLGRDLVLEHVQRDVVAEQALEAHVDVVGVDRLAALLQDVEELLAVDDAGDGVGPDRGDPSSRA